MRDGENGETGVIEINRGEIKEQRQREGEKNQIRRGPREIRFGGERNSLASKTPYKFPDWTKPWSNRWSCSRRGVSGAGASPAII